MQYARRFEVTFVATGLQPGLRGAFERIGAREHWGVCVFADLDHGLEYCEDQILAMARVRRRRPRRRLSSNYALLAAAIARSPRWCAMLRGGGMPRAKP